MLGAFQNTELDAGLGGSLQMAMAGINHQSLAQSSTRATTLNRGRKGRAGLSPAPAIATVGAMP